MTEVKKRWGYALPLHKRDPAKDRTPDYSDLDRWEQVARPADDVLEAWIAGGKGRVREVDGKEIVEILIPGAAFKVKMTLAEKQRHIAQMNKAPLSPAEIAKHFPDEIPEPVAVPMKRIKRLRPGEDMRPGTYTIQRRGGGTGPKAEPVRSVPILSCPLCGRLGELSDHPILEDGVVDKVVVCPHAGCDYQNWLQLEEWNGGK